MRKIGFQYRKFTELTREKRSYGERRLKYYTSIRFVTREQRSNNVRTDAPIRCTTDVHGPTGSRGEINTRLGKSYRREIANNKKQRTKSGVRSKGPDECYGSFPKLHNNVFERYLAKSYFY